MQPDPYGQTTYQQPQTYAQPQATYAQPQMYGQPQMAPMGQTIVVGGGGGGNGMATTAMIMGIVTWVAMLLGMIIPFVGCLSPLTALLGIIFGHIGLSQSKRSGGAGMAITGLVLNYIYMILIIVGLIFLGAALSSL